MSPLLGSSLYDSLNRLVIGFLLSLWFFAIPCFDISCIDYPITLCIYIIVCFITGLFFSLLIDKLAGINKPGINFFFYKNKLANIRQICIRNSIPFPDTDKYEALSTYYTYYYTVQRAGLLGSIPALETLSAFLMNLCGVCVLSLFLSACLLLNKNCSIYCCCHCCNICLCIILISFIILILSKLGRDYIEKRYIQM